MSICISVETVQIRIVGDEHIEFMQGRPFGFEVECVTADGEPTQGLLEFHVCCLGGGGVSGDARDPTPPPPLL